MACLFGIERACDNIRIDDNTHWFSFVLSWCELFTNYCGPGLRLTVVGKTLNIGLRLLVDGGLFFFCRAGLGFLEDVSGSLSLIQVS